MIEIYKFDKDAKTPTRANYTDAGLDLYCNESVFLPLGKTLAISTGIGIHVPKGSTGKVEDRSSLALSGLRTGGGIIDAGYSGEIRVVMHNLNKSDSFRYDVHTGNNEHGTWIVKGDKIAQFLLYKVETAPAIETNILWNSERGNSGFGSSGQ